jgi:hypothetical protein
VPAAGPSTRGVHSGPGPVDPISVNQMPYAVLAEPGQHSSRSGRAGTHSQAAEGAGVGAGAGAGVVGRGGSDSRFGTPRDPEGSPRVSAWPLEQDLMSTARYFTQSPQARSGSRSPSAGTSPVSQRRGRGGSSQAAPDTPSSGDTAVAGAGAVLMTEGAL